MKLMKLSNINKYLIIFVISIILISSCKFDKKSEPIDVYGCMDSTATNYNPNATIDDGSCDYCVQGSSFILLSTDGGNNWDIRCLKETIGRVTDISMIDSNNIWLCTYANTNVNILNSQILYTSNGGENWIVQFADSTGRKFINYIEMFDLNNGIAMADGETDVPIFLKTIDGGNNWVQTSTQAIGGASGDTWRRLDFVDVNTGYFYESGINPQKLYKTTDSGITWTETDFDGYAQVLKFYNENIGIIVQGEGKIHRTLDGAETWEEIETTHTGWGLDIEFDPYDPSRVWMLSGGLFFSNDTGSTWDFCFDNTYNGADAICFSESSLWVYNLGRYLRNIETDDCNNYLEYQLPEYSYGDLILGHDFDVIGDVIVIPGQFSE